PVETVIGDDTGIVLAAPGPQHQGLIGPARSPDAVPVSARFHLDELGFHPYLIPIGHNRLEVLGNTGPDLGEVEFRSKPVGIARTSQELLRPLWVVCTLLRHFLPPAEGIEAVHRARWGRQPSVYLLADGLLIDGQVQGLPGPNISERTRLDGRIFLRPARPIRFARTLAFLRRLQRVEGDQRLRGPKQGLHPLALARLPWQIPGDSQVDRHDHIGLSTLQHGQAGSAVRDPDDLKGSSLGLLVPWVVAPELLVALVDDAVPRDPLLHLIGPTTQRLFDITLMANLHEVVLGHNPEADVPRPTIKGK